MIGSSSPALQAVFSLRFFLVSPYRWACHFQWKFRALPHTDRRRFPSSVDSIPTSMNLVQAAKALQFALVI